MSTILDNKSYINLKKHCIYITSTVCTGMMFGKYANIQTTYLKDILESIDVEYINDPAESEYQQSEKCYELFYKEIRDSGSDIRGETFDFNLMWGNTKSLKLYWMSIYSGINITPLKDIIRQSDIHICENSIKWLLNYSKEFNETILCAFKELLSSVGIDRSLYESQNELIRLEIPIEDKHIINNEKRLKEFMKITINILSKIPK